MTSDCARRVFCLIDETDGEIHALVFGHPRLQQPAATGKQRLGIGPVVEHRIVEADGQQPVAQLGHRLAVDGGRVGVVFLHQQQHDLARALDGDDAAPLADRLGVDGSRPGRERCDGGTSLQHRPKATEAGARIRLRRLGIADADAVMRDVHARRRLHQVRALRLRIAVDQLAFADDLPFGADADDGGDELAVDHRIRLAWHAGDGVGQPPLVALDDGHVEAARVEQHEAEVAVAAVRDTRRGEQRGRVVDEIRSCQDTSAAEGGRRAAHRAGGQPDDGK